MFYLTTHSTHFIYGYMASDIWLRTILIVRKEARCRHIGYSYRLTAMDERNVDNLDQAATMADDYALIHKKGRKERSVLFNDALNTFFTVIWR